MNMTNGTRHANVLIAPRYPRCTPKVDPKTVSQIHEQLLLIFHASDCQTFEIKANADGEEYQCDYPKCSTMRFVLNHLNSCEKGKSCTVPHCSTTRQHLDHWNYCKKSSCPACSPLRQQTIPNHGSSFGVANYTVQTTSNQWFGEARFFVPGQYDNTGNLDHFEVPSHSEFLDNRYSPALASEKPTLLPEHPAPFTLGDDSKNWRLDVTYDQRNLFVYKLIHGAFQFSDPEALFDAKMQKLEEHARKLEDDIFQRANSRPEYIALMSQKVTDLKAEFYAVNGGKQGLMFAPTPDSYLY